MSPPVPTGDERAILAAMANDIHAPRLALRARIILAAAEGGSISQVAGKLKTSRLNVRRWLERFETKRLAGLITACGRGPRSKKVDWEQGLVALLEGADPPSKHQADQLSDWRDLTQRKLAVKIGVSAATLNRAMHRHRLHLPNQRRATWRNHAGNLALLGMYLDPPTAILAICRRPQLHHTTNTVASESSRQRFMAEVASLQLALATKQVDAGRLTSVQRYLNQLNRLWTGDPIELWGHQAEAGIQPLIQSFPNLHWRDIPRTGAADKSWLDILLEADETAFIDGTEFGDWSRFIHLSLLRHRRRSKRLARPWFRTLIRPTSSAVGRTAPRFSRPEPQEAAGF